MAIKELLTRFAINYDTYENWSKTDTPEQGANLVLLPGDIGLCAVSNINEGDDKITNPPTVLFKVGDGVTSFGQLKWASATAADVYSWAKAETVEIDSTTKKLVFKTGDDIKLSLDLSGFTTEDKTIELAARVAALEAANGDASAGNEIVEQLAELTNKLEIIQGEGDGSILKVLADSKTYTDNSINSLSSNISDISDDIITLKSDLAKEVASRNDADDSLAARLAALEAFFAEADHDGVDGGLTDALDSLIEIQKYLSGDGSATDGLLDIVSEHTKDIENIWKIVDSDTGTLETRVRTLESETAQQDSSITELQKITAGFSESETIESALISVQQTAENAQEVATNVYGLASELNTVIHDPDQGLAKAYELALTATSEIAAIKADYLTSKDEYIFNCGSSQEVLHAK